jgi:hypothetical protein
MEVGMCAMSPICERFKKYDFGQIYHLAGLLSVGGEKNPDRAWRVICSA